MADAELKVKGLDELKMSFDQLVAKYPDKAGDLLKKDALALRRNIVNNAKELTKTKSEHKRSLGKLSSFRVSQVQGLMNNQFVEISANSPHFHLVEKGHELKTPEGDVIGFVQGVHYLDKATKVYEDKFEEHVDKMVGALLKEGGLI